MIQMKKFIRFLLPLIVLFIAALVMMRLIKSKQRPNKMATAETQILVETLQVKITAAHPLIRAAGTVLPSRQLEVRSQLGGKIVTMADSLEPGGFFKEGQPILSIDDRDYQLGMQRRLADVEKARFEVIDEKGRGAVAAKEWALLGKELETSAEGRELSLRLPHLRRAEASLAIAEAAVAEARLSLERTVVTSPFNAQVRSENVDMGQVISPQSKIATLTGTDRYWVRVALSLDQLGFLTLPTAGAEGSSRVKVIHSAGGTSIEKAGTILQLLGQLEEAGRLALLLIAVDDPLGLSSGNAALPLLLDAFVRVEFEGKLLPEVVALPPHTLHEGNRVWVMNGEDRLEIRPVTVVWQEEDRILVSEGLKEGDRVITSRIATPLPGLKLMLKRSKAKAAAEEGSGV